MAENNNGRGEHPSEPAEGSRQAGERAEEKTARQQEERTGDDRRSEPNGPRGD